MGQLTVYINDDILKKIEKAAKHEHTSISKWVKERLEKSFDQRWPGGYAEILGSLKGMNMKRPKQPPLSKDVRRASL